MITPNKYNQTSDGKISTNRKGQDKSDRVYVKVPITEVIIKTSVLPDASKRKSKSRKNTDLGHIGSTVKLQTSKITTHESEEPIIARGHNKDLISD